MHTFLNGLRSSLLWLSLVLCMAFGNTAIADSAEEEFEKLEKQYADQFWTYLQTSQYNQLRVSSAIRLFRSDDPSQKKHGIQLVDEVLEQPVIDPGVLWSITQICGQPNSATWCETGEVYHRLRQSDSQNAAVLLLEFSQTDNPDDESLLATEARLEFLESAANAWRFDVYFGRGTDKAFIEALTFIDEHPIPHLLLNEVPTEFPPHTHAFNVALLFLVTEWVASSGPSYQKLTELCREQSSQQYEQGIALCKKLAKLMQRRGTTALSRMIGFAIEKNIVENINPDDPAIQTIELREEAHRMHLRCWSQLWTNHPERWADISQGQMMSVAKNLDKLGEWDGYSLALLKDYEVSPDKFIVDPSECLGLWELDDESLTKFMDGRSADEVWQQWQDEASANEQSRCIVM